jgi:hypothetical protein
LNLRDCHPKVVSASMDPLLPCSGQHTSVRRLLSLWTRPQCSCVCRMV